jgi:hypothetical protein
MTLKVGSGGGITTTATTVAEAAAEAAPVPFALIAETVTAYDPAARLEMVQVVAVAATVPHVVVELPETAETAYPVIALPPVFVGATHEIASVPVPPVAVTPVGAVGTVVAATMIEAEAAETNEVVPLPEGVTVKVYASPLVKPVTLQDCGTVADGGVLLLMTVHVPLAALLDVDAEATVYVEATPSAVKLTATAPVPANATVGVAKGVVPGEIDAEVATVETVPVPLGVTVNV